MRQLSISLPLLVKKRLRYAALGVLLATGAAQAQSGNALNFDGTDDHVDLPLSMVTGVTDFTFETWLNYQDNRNWTRVLDFGQSTGINMFLTPRNQYTDTPRFAITVNGAGAEEQLTSPTVLSTGQHHLAVTLSRNSTSGVVTGTLYINGVAVATNSNMTLTPNSLEPASYLYLGRSEYGGDPNLKGEFDETRFYNTALTEAQIKADMRSTHSAVPASLLAYYDYNQGIADGNNPNETSLLDRSGKGHTGTLVNFALTTGATSNWVGSTAPLPVTLVSFAAQRQQEAGLLTWATASESGNAYFEVESSADGTTFRPLGRVVGAGTTSQTRRYQFTDPNLLRYPTAVVYYRLRQVDTDGTSAYSTVCMLPVPVAALGVEAFPAPLPAGQGLRVQVRTPAAGPAHVAVTDVLGHTVLQQALDLPAGTTAIALPQAAQWHSGLYVLRVQQGGREQVVKVTHE